MDGEQVVGAESGFGMTSITEFYGTELYLPDGNDVPYSTVINVSGFPEGTTITSGSDLDALCVNMEHSYLGDLEMMLACPGQDGIIIFNSHTGNGLFEGGFGGGGTYLGDAYDGLDYQISGIGFDYCFSDDAEWGTLGEEYQAGNFVPVTTFQNGNAMFPGTYQPEAGFENFIGCPVNGDWVLTVLDNLYSDDGYIFDWSLGFSDELSTSGFQSELVSAAWEANDWITAVNDGFIEITPQSTEPNELTFTVSDENGCSFSKNLSVQISDTLEGINEPVICELSYNLEWPSSIGEVNFLSGPSSNVTISNNGANFEIEVPETGDYTFEFNYFDCSSVAQANLTFLEENDPACITSIQEIDFNKQFTLAPNPASHFTEVKFEIRNAQDVQITLTTVDGKVASKAKYRLPSGTQNQRINLDNLESGAYILTIRGETFKSSGLIIKK